MSSLVWSRALFAITLALSVLYGRRAHAIDTTWTSNNSGSWLSAGNWDNGEPNNATYNAIIDDGDAAVSVTLNNAARTVGSVAIGADDTLAIQSISNPATDGYLTVANGINNSGTLVLNANGADPVTLDITGGALNNAAGAQFTATGPFVLTNFTFRGDLVNHGSVDLAHEMTFNKGAGASYANYGTFRIGESLSMFGGTFDQFDGVLQIVDQGNFSALTTTAELNLRGGEMQVAGNISLANGAIEGIFSHFGGALNHANGAFSSGTYNFLGGTVTGTPRIKSSSFVIGPAATSPASFILEDDIAFAGDVHAGQQITVKNTSTFSYGLTAASGITNDGSIFVTAANTGGVEFDISSGTLTNSNTGLLHFQSGGSGFRRFSANLVNNGAVIVGETISFLKGDGTFTNNNQFTIASVKTLTVNGTFEQAAGTLDILGNFTQSGGTFQYLGGTINGAPSIHNGALHIGAAAANAASFTVENTALTLENGTLAAGKPVTVTSGNLTSATGFTNEGTLTVTGRSGSSGSGITVTTGALTNNLLLQFLPNFPGTRTLNGNLINNGTVNISSGTTFNSPSGTYVNSGQFSIGSTRTLTITSGGTFEQAGGNLNIVGLLSLQSGTTFKYTGGTIAGNIVINNAALNIDGATSAASFTLAGASTLSVGASGIATGQVVRLLNEFSTTLTATAPTGFSNAGEINLTGTNNGITRLSIASGALVNKTNGFVRFQSGGNGMRSFVGDLTNDGGTVLVDHATTFSKTAGVFEQTGGTTTVNANRTLTFSGGSQLKLPGGTLDLKGKIAGAATTLSGGTINFTTGGSFVGGTFTFLGGTMNGTPLLSDTDLTVGAAATAPFTVHLIGSSALTLADNKLNAGQKLILTDSIGSSTTIVVAANGFSNEGTIEFAPQNFRNARLSITNGTLVNAAAGVVRSPQGFISGELNADVVNHGTFEIDGRLEIRKQSALFSNQGQVVVRGALTRSVFTASYEQTAGATHVNGLLDFSSPVRFLGGRLSGKGTIAGLVENVAASVEPGEGLGTLTAFGGYTQQSGGELTIELAGTQANQFDVLRILSGTATLAGTLNVQLVDPGTGLFVPQAGNAFTILTATAGITGQFTSLNLPALTSNLAWKLRYTTNDLTLVATLPYDFNGDGEVSAADYVLWRDTLGQSIHAGTGADANFDGQITTADFDLWRAHFGETVGSASATAAVPEPSALLLVCFGSPAVFWRRRCGWSTANKSWGNAPTT
jgi:hypothetical protein